MVSVGFHGQCVWLVLSLHRRPGLEAHHGGLVVRGPGTDVGQCFKALHVLNGDSAQVSAALQGLRHGWRRAVTRASLAPLAISIAFNYSLWTSHSIADL